MEKQTSTAAQATPPNSRIKTTARARKIPAHKCYASLAEPEMEDLPLEQAERLERVYNACHMVRDGHVDRMTSHRRTRTTYCMVPKSSCTFWLSLFRSLNPDDTVKLFKHPLKIPRTLVHRYTRIQKFQSIKRSQSLPYHQKNHFRFMFVRDPYTRLWSSYIDKFFLLDFWFLYGKKIVNFLESDRGTEMLGFRRNFSSCYSDISFAEFVSYVVDRGENDSTSLNEHWRPVEHVCNPCQFCPSMVGHVETFARDSSSVLKRLNLTWVLQDYDHGLQQMQLLMEDNLGQLFKGYITRNYKGYSRCTNNTEVSRRLWAAFQMYGYIPESSPFPAQEFENNFSAQHFKEVVFQIYKTMPDSVRKTLPQQRARAMEKAYATVPLRTLERLAPLYSFEFAAFGYEMKPRSLFENGAL